MRKIHIISLALLFCAIVGCRSLRHSQPVQSAWTKDWSAKNSVWRGVHLTVASDQQADALIEQLPRLSAVGVNVIVAEVDYSFEFDSHPEVRDARFMTKAAAHRLAKAAHSQGIRLIPQINCLGHQSWSAHTLPLLVQHPEFDETPGKYPRNTNIYCRSWCPENPAVNKLVFDLVDEMIDAFEADAFHVGMDEVFIVGSEYCPRCKGKDPAQLFARAVNDFHQHIVSDKKIEMLIWGDRLLDAKAQHYSEWEAATNGTAGAVDLIPKGIIVCDWHYGKKSTYASVPFLLEKGFRVWPSGWQPLESSLAFSKFCHSQNNPRLIGYLATTWGKARINNAADWPPIVEVLKDWK